MQTKGIVINSSKTVLAKDGSVVDILKLSNGVFKIDNFCASEVFLLVDDKSMLFACGVNFSSTAVNPTAGDPRGLVCRFEIDLDTLKDYVPQTPEMGSPSCSQDSQATLGF